MDLKNSLKRNASSIFNSEFEVSKPDDRPGHDLNTVDFVEESEIAASIALKEKNNELLIEGSEASVDSLSNLSDFSTSSLNVLKDRKEKLLDSIRSQLISSPSYSTEKKSANKTSINKYNFDSNIPCKKSTLPTTNDLVELEPFLNSKQDYVNTITSQKYEEAFSNLASILSSTSNADILDVFDDSLTNNPDESNKKLDELLSFFSENESVFEDLIKIEDFENSSDHKIKENQQKTQDSEETLIGGEDDLYQVLTPAEEEEILKSDCELDYRNSMDGAEEFENNDVEYHDNNNLQWEKFKNLGSNFEKCMAVRASWENNNMANPKVDLSRIYRRSCGHNNTIAVDVNQNTSYIFSELNSNRKRFHSPDDFEHAKKLKLGTYIEIFKQIIGKCRAHFENRRSFLRERIKNEAKLAVMRLNSKHKATRLHAIRNNASHDELTSLDRSLMMESYLKIASFSEQRKKMEKNMQDYLDELDNTSNEITEIFQYYLRDDQRGNDTVYTNIIMDIENMATRFETFYRIVNNYRYNNYYNFINC